PISVVGADCKELRENGHTDSGVYEIYPYGTYTSPISVYCDMNTEGGGWTAIQKRVNNGSVSFDRTWKEYKKGFGDAGLDFWIGNEVIYQLTKRQISNLYIIINLVDGSRLYELYDQFSVSNEADSYRLFLAGNASGTLGDSMMHTGYSRLNLSGMKFTTSDRDNDQYDEGSCSSLNKGGWWFNNCRLAFLNGPWSTIRWPPKVTFWTPVYETLMMIRHH
ncbi:fibroleukin-like, partial [Saccostrea cucullata]|uniref:fibroleukin-like n=1 Tax=Saccostrea cuccullata TaxID=36930 RepID=UPI002ED16936